MIVVKLGGSLLTNKKRARTKRPRVIERLAREVARSDRAVALVHGAGSFGHVEAERHDLAAGRRGERKQDAAASRVHRDVRVLHAAVLEALAKARARPIGVASWDVAALQYGTLAAFDSTPFRHALTAGLMPVGFGDIVPDRGRGFGVLSGDVVVERLARDLNPERVVFATDVDGLFDRPPSEPGARLLERVRPDEALAALAAGATTVDVTGGMAGKVARITAIARGGVPVTIVNGDVRGRVADAVAGRKVRGTVVAL